MYHLWTYLNTADFNLNGQNSGTLTICGNDPIIMNAAASRHEDSYGIAIWEVNAQNQGVGSEKIVEYSCPAPNGINIRSLAASKGILLGGGKRYYVKLFTKPNWQEKIMFVELKQASLRDLLSNSFRGYYLMGAAAGAKEVR
jgi:hypothetical protein